MAFIRSWRGPQVAARVEAATKQAIDAITERAAEDAQANHWWQNRTGELESNIIAEPAERRADGRVVGRFGTSLRREGFYGLFLERRQPFLRPAADRNFPALPLEIRARMMLADRILTRFM